MAILIAFPSTVPKAAADREDISKVSGAEHALKFEVVSSEALKELSKKFSDYDGSEKDRSGWIGADAAYTFPIASDKTLWMFGDTFVKDFDHPNKATSRMFNNSVGIQTIDNPLQPIKFILHSHQSGNRKSLLTLPDASKWLWPLDGVTYGGALYEFMNVIEKSRSSEPGAFGFQSVNQLLMKVIGPLAEPNSWKIRMNQLVAPNMQFGNAALTDGDFIYTFNTFEPASKNFERHPIIVARLPLRELDNICSNSDVGKNWEFWCRSSSFNSATWIKPGLAKQLPSLNPIVLMQDGAPEFSVTRIKGLEGFFALYFPCGFGADIVMRHANKPEGPWSAPQTIFHCEIKDTDHFVYSAKAHQELATAPGELILTYCENTRSTKTIPESPEQFYFPHAIKIRLREKLTPLTSKPVTSVTDNRAGSVKSDDN